MHVFRRSRAGMTGTTRRVSMSMEGLEPRVLLAGTPLPDISTLENAGDTVIRFETTYGDVDIELFNSLVATTVNNFVNYVTSGREDKTFFHRVTDVASQNIGVLQGGGFLYTNGGGLQEVATDAPIPLEARRSNLARTIAMARTNAANSATSQFYFNTTDNTNLDATANNPGFAVFGKVIQGWSVIQTISALRVFDLRTDPAFTGPLAGNFQTTPVTESYTSAGGVRESALVYIVNAEVIKPAGNTGFYERRVVFPEGHRTGGSTETIELTNPNNGTATYQIIARYETGLRDTVISSGTLNANTHLELQLSIAGQATPSLVRQDVPYALVVETSLPASVTNPVAIMASSNRLDFGAAAGESFVDPSQYSTVDLKTWQFARIERNPQSKEFLLWVNLSDRTATVTMTFSIENGVPMTFTSTLEAYRRGGAEVFNLAGLPEGVLGATVSADQPIVAALSDWDIPVDSAVGQPSYTPGWTVMGLPGGSSAGSIASVEIHAGFSNILSIMNPTGNLAAVTLTLYRDNRPAGENPIERIAIVPGGRRQDLDLASIPGVTAGNRYSVKYSAGIARIALQYTLVDESERNVATTKKADGVSTMLTSRASGTVYFSDGFIDPTRNSAQQSEILSVFNPFANTSVTINFAVVALFSDGTSVGLTSGSVASQQRFDFATDANVQLRTKAGASLAFRHYTLVVTGTAVGTSAGDIANVGFVSLVRQDSLLGRSIATGGILGDAGRDLASDPIFLPGGSGGTGG